MSKMLPESLHPLCDVREDPREGSFPQCHRHQQAVFPAAKRNTGFTMIRERNLAQIVEDIGCVRGDGYCRCRGGA